MSKSLVGLLVMLVNKVWMLKKMMFLPTHGVSRETGWMLLMSGADIYHGAVKKLQIKAVPVPEV